MLKRPGERRGCSPTLLIGALLAAFAVVAVGVWTMAERPANRTITPVDGNYRPAQPTSEKP
jgi:ABC-type cobalt transport system substrate-binding protein